MIRSRKLDISSAGLHILAMGMMLCDHLWATLFPEQEWLTCIGRLAFPIFAFLAAEGFRHTYNLRRYLLRLLIGALLAEIPFNLMCSDSVFYPYHQNVLWTFLLALVCIALTEKCRARFRPVFAVPACAAVMLLGFLLGYAAMLDYYGIGVLTVFTFYFFKRQNWIDRVCQLLCLYYLNVTLLGGYCYAVSLFGHEFEFAQQGFALIALLPIWLYQGRQGTHGKAFRFFCYAFYPAHMLLLFLVRTWVLQ